MNFVFFCLKGIHCFYEKKDMKQLKSLTFSEMKKKKQKTQFGL